MDLTVTSSALPFETRSRWEQGSPGGFVSGQMTLPSNNCTVTLECLQATSNLPSPCRLHLPSFDGKGNRVKECVNHLDKAKCAEGKLCKKKFKDTLGERPSKVILLVDGTEVWATKAMGESQEPQKERIVARVSEEGQHIVYLGMLSEWKPKCFSLLNKNVSCENNAIWSLSAQLLGRADSMPLPGIENLLDAASLENLFEGSLSQAPVQETIPAIAEDPSVQSSQRISELERKLK